MRDPDVVLRAQQAAAVLERAWDHWRTLHGVGAGALPPVSSYVGYSLEEPWGQPRVVFGIAAEEAEQLAALLDRFGYGGAGSGSGGGRPGDLFPDGGPMDETPLAAAAQRAFARSRSQVPSQGLSQAPSQGLSAPGAETVLDRPGSGSGSGSGSGAGAGASRPAPPLSGLGVLPPMTPFRPYGGRAGPDGVLPPGGLLPPLAPYPIEWYPADPYLPNGQGAAGNGHIPANGHSPHSYGQQAANGQHPPAGPAGPAGPVARGRQGRRGRIFRRTGWQRLMATTPPTDTRGPMAVRPVMARTRAVTRTPAVTRTRAAARTRAARTPESSRTARSSRPTALTAQAVSRPPRRPILRQPSNSPR